MNVHFHLLLPILEALEQNLKSKHYAVSQAVKPDPKHNISCY